MKKLNNLFFCTFSLIPCLCSAQTATGTQSSTISSSTQPAIVARDANSRTWEWAETDSGPNGETIQKIHHYTELATGLCYQQNGQWQDSQEQINIQSDGSASATQGEHQVYFPANIYNGVITLITPDGLQLKSQPVGLSYYDGTNTVLIAESTNSVGQLISSNQIIYTNAFVGIDADLLYTYTKAGFEQDVIFREQPPTPEQFGLDSQNVRLQMLTEFFDPPTAVEHASPVNPQDGLQDTTLAFGAMSMVRGKAFLMNTLDNQDDINEIPVYKSLVTVDGRTLLIEQVPYQRISPQLTTLPLLSASTSSTVNSALGRVSAKRLLPPIRLTATGTNSVRLAKAEIKKKSGVVLDYVTIDSSETNFTFQGDTTYYVSGLYQLSGTTVLEGGTVIKMNGSGELDIDDANGDANATIECETSPYRPAIFTSYNDNTWGEEIGSGSPAYTDVNHYLVMNETTNITLSNVRFNYCELAIEQNVSSSSITVRDGQFYHDKVAIDGWDISLFNVLMSFNVVTSGDLVIFNGSNFVGEQATVDDENNAFINPVGEGTMALTNCIFTSTNTSFELALSGGTLETNDVAFLIKPSQPVYQAVGGGNYYLTNNSPYRTNGTVNIDPTLLTDLTQRTTHPPVVYNDTNISSLGTLSPTVSRDTNSSPDLGFHYAPLDYVFAASDLSSNLTVTNGTAVGWFLNHGSAPSSGQPYGISLKNGANLSFNGNVTQPCYFVNYQMVQEADGNWTDLGYMPGLMFDGTSTSQEPQLSANFTMFIGPDSPNTICDNWSYGEGGFENSEFYNVGITTYKMQYLNFTNCLLFRDAMPFWDQDYALSFNFENCTFYGGGLGLVRYSGQNSSFWQVENCAFDGTAFGWDDYDNGNTNHTLFNYNAYNTNNLSWQTYPMPYLTLYGTLETVGSNDVMVTNYNWESSWFGDFYLPTNSPLDEAGSTNANDLGLYEFTTETNQTPETTNMVDIGYHYVATDTNGNPLDTLWFGIPDYLDDPNGALANWQLTYLGQFGWSTNYVPNGGVNTILYDYQHSIAPYSFYMTMLPLSQTVMWGDSVTFAVQTAGNTNLTYQWTSNSVPIVGATNTAYTIETLWGWTGPTAGFSCVISDGTNSITAQPGELTEVDLNYDPFSYWNGYFTPFLMQVIGPRQDYTFKENMTYYINSPVVLYGNTTIEGGAVFKIDSDYSTNSCLIVNGGLTCDTGPYNPAVLTSIDDDANGEPLVYLSTDVPLTVSTGTPYLSLTHSQSNSISYLRFCFADQGVTTPSTSQQLNVWDCQFVECNNGVMNLVNGANDFLHNVLFAHCGAAVGASNNLISISGEQVTADVVNFCSAMRTPTSIALTNSIVGGSQPVASSLSMPDSVVNPASSNFVAQDYGTYYLASNSPLRAQGTPNISPRLQTELQNKTTCAPISISAGLQMTGNLTFGPQSPRYTNGAPDLGYYYDVIDYSVGDVNLVGGSSTTVLPGTVIADCNEYSPSEGIYTWKGFDVQEGSTFTSQGTPERPNIFTAEKAVQEYPESDYYTFLLEAGWYDGFFYAGDVTFVLDFETDPNGFLAPTMNFRFSKFYLSGDDYHISGGQSEYDFTEVSPDSSVYLTLQDCAFQGGRFNVGNPDYDTYGPTQVYAPGAITLLNNSFDDVAINLDPSYYWNFQTINCDMQVVATNNLFKGGEWFHIEPFPASAGNWTFEDNLFDDVDIVQDTNAPAVFNYNGYWPISEWGLYWDSYFTQYAYWNYYMLDEFDPTITGDSQNDVTLTTPPPYQSGPFGNFYMPTNTPLYGAGSDTPADMGLYHYTTRIDQVKEGQDTTKVNSNIGVHYIAATNVPGTSVYEPMDTDGDGIPDYMENWHGDGNYPAHVGIETDWQNPITDGVDPDPSNSVYLNIDLSGDGLVGRIKAVLGMNPLNSNNPLTLNQIITGQEPDILTFEVSVNYNTLTNIGELNLNLDGTDVEFENVSPGTDGNALLIWNTTYHAPGQHYLQPHLTIDNIGDDTAVITANGVVAPFNSTNAFEFFEADSLYDTNAYLDAQLPPQYNNQNVNYTIELDDPSTTPPTPLNTITGSTSSGTVQETWNMVENDGITTFGGNTFTATFSASFPDGTSGKNTKTLNKIVTTELVGPPVGNHDGFDFAYMYMPTNSALAYDYSGNYPDEGYIWLAMLNPLDTLLSPQSSSYYDSTFDTYDNQDFPGQIGDPGYCETEFDITNSTGSLFSSMGDGLTKNFYCKAHGSGISMSSYSPNAKTTPSAYFYSWDITARLRNFYYTKNGVNGGLHPGNPYRFVFLDGCSTASKDWRRAFGIMPIWAGSQSRLYNLGPQAFVAWGTTNVTWIGGDYPTDGTFNYNESINWSTAFARNLTFDFYLEWMGGTALASCIYTASNPKDGSAPFGVPQYSTQSFTVTGNDYLGQYSYPFNNIPFTSPIFVVGHSGLKRYGYDATQDNLYHDPDDHN